MHELVLELADVLLSITPECLDKDGHVCILPGTAAQVIREWVDVDPNDQDRVKAAIHCMNYLTE